MKLKYDILTVGFPLVEIMREKRGVLFNEVGHFLGPYPSGDTCIMLDVAARLGKKCCFFGTVGKDAFGTMVMERLNSDGVDISYVRQIEKGFTAAVFVRYEENGKREYLDFIENSASSQLRPEDIVPEVIANSTWIHFSGEVLSNCIDSLRRTAMEKLLDNITENSKVCLDPNFTVQVKNMREVMGPFIERADLILPSEGEAKLLMGTQSDEEACRILAGMGKIVALKKGKQGCDIYQGENVIHAEPFCVEEIDPTGCGDSFCAGFITGLLEEWPLQEVGRFANEVGALQAMEQGPMEGAKTYEEVKKFIAEHEGGK